MRFLTGALAALIVAAAAVAGALFAFGEKDALAHQISGAIFTTTATGNQVNENLFPSKEAVYLDGGPGPGAPQGAAGMDDGSYVFQVTNPNGQKLLSSDPARCRQFTVLNGIINGVVNTDCDHATGVDIDHNATPVQLAPFDNTPNHGGVYKVWVTRLDDFLLGCQNLGKPGNTGLDLVDCGDAAANHHGFIPAHSKTDNYKVRTSSPKEGTEIDVRFFVDANNDGHYSWDASEPLICGLEVKWTDTLGVQNTKFSDPANSCQAHIEQAELGTHTIQIIGGAACDGGLVHVDNVDKAVGLPQTVTVTVVPKDITHFVDVACIPD